MYCQSTHTFVSCLPPNCEMPNWEKKPQIHHTQIPHFINEQTDGQDS